MENLRLDRILGVIVVVVFLFFVFRKCSGRASNLNANANRGDSTAVAATPNKPVVDASTKQRVYVAMDSLKMRSGPSKDSTMVAILRINEELLFTGERTAGLTKMKLDDVVYNEPWVRVKSQKGKQGWVYGAGVRFYKK